MLSQDYDMVFKILIIGNSSVGKSSFLLRFADDSFNDSFLPTIGVDFKIKTITNEGTVIKLQIWDTAGQEKFKTITAAYYKGAQGLILVFDISDRKSFMDLQNWLDQAQKYASANIVKLLIGNKADLQANRQVSSEQARRFAEALGMEYLQVSAKTTQNVEQTFTTLSTKMKNEFVASRPTKISKKDKTCLLQVSDHRKKPSTCWDFFKKIIPI